MADTVNTISLAEQRIVAWTPFRFRIKSPSEGEGVELLPIGETR